jgi:hypothetical protein
MLRGRQFSSVVFSAYFCNRRKNVPARSIITSKLTESFPSAISQHEMHRLFLISSFLANAWLEDF